MAKDFRILPESDDSGLPFPAETTSASARADLPAVTDPALQDGAQDVALAEGAAPGDLLEAAPDSADEAAKVGWTLAADGSYGATLGEGAANDHALDTILAAWASRPQDLRIGIGQTFDTLSLPGWNGVQVTVTAGSAADGGGPDHGADHGHDHGADPVQTGVALPGNFWVRGLTGTTRWDGGALSYALSNGTLSDWNYYDTNAATLSGLTGATQANHQNLNTGGGNAGAIRGEIFTAEAMFENVANITLNYFSGAGDFQSGTVDFRFMAFNNLSGLNGIATFPGTDPSPDSFESFVLYNNNTSSMTQTPELGAATNRQHVVIHEWLHGLGLGHPHDTGTGSASWTTSNNTGAGEDELDNDRYTVMSYERGGLDQNNQTLTYGYATTPMALDVAALHWLYGSAANHTGNTVYTLTDAGTVALDVDGDDGTVSIGRAFYCIWDTGGIDEIRYSGSRSTVINLNEATMTTSVSSALADIIADLTGDSYYNSILPSATAGEVRTDQTNSQYFAGGFFSRVIDSTTGAADLGGYSIANSLYASGGQTTVIENATGGSGADILIGNEQANTLTGNGGDDLLIAGGGTDYVYGGAGTDHIYGGDGTDLLYGGAGYDSIYGGAGTNYFYGEADGAYMVGGANTDYFFAYLGQDNEDAYGGDGDDGYYIYYGLDEYDDFYGGAGNDFVYYSAAAAVVANLAAGTLNYVTGAFFSALDMSSVETFYGGSGDDIITGSNDGNYLSGNSGNDSIDGGAGVDTIYGGNGNDILSGGLGSGDSLYGDGGDDTLFVRAGEGSDHLDGGAGFDTADFSNMTLNLTVDMAAGQYGYGALTYTLAGFERFDSGSGNDTITGSDAADRIYGAAGNDTLNGGLGQDTLYGQAGNDIFVDNQAMSVGQEDTYSGGNGIDTLIHDLNWVSDVVFDLTAGFSRFLGVDFDRLISIENVTVGGSAQVKGSAVGNVITITSGNNTNFIWGEDGADTVYANGGADTVYGGAGIDSLYGEDGDDYLNGGFDGDYLYGGAGNDQMVGLAGFDTFEGGTGDDIYFINSSADAIIEYAGQGIDKIFCPVSVNLMAMSLEVENVTLQGILDRNINGNDLDNILVGNSGNNIINGGYGDDLINGGDGNDTLNGSFGNDTLIGGAGDDQLIGGTGDDTMNGQTGSDVFIFAGAFGNDRINGFSIADAAEYIDLSAIGAITDFADLAANHLSQTGAGALITAGAHSVLLAGILATDLTANEFIF